MHNKIGFISLGCCKNLVDAERMITILKCNGYDIVPNYEDADLIVINTCGFINPSIDESISTIQESLTTEKKVVVTGCLGTRAEFIKQHFPNNSNLVAITGPQNYDKVNEIIKKVLPLDIPQKCQYSSMPIPGVKLTPPHYAYLKISEGCSNKCSFCAIPSLRGKMISRPINEIMFETEQLISEGYKELMVVAQDTLTYGKDLKNVQVEYKNKSYQSNIITLVDFLSKQDIWVRLHYLYPYATIDKLIPYMKDSSIIPYLDMPLQHSSPNILKLMRRPGNIDRIADKILEWKENIPSLCIRTSFIVGFPGETDTDFENLLNFIQKVKLHRVGCFKFSNVYGVDANNLPNQITEEVKQERYNKFMEIQQQISTNLLKQYVGTTIDAIIDDIDYEEQVIIARSKYDSPDIDGQVYIPYDKGTKLPKIGDIVKTQIYDSNEYDIFGEL